jgi:Putative Flp pilus-assembly TadE/G-like
VLVAAAMVALLAMVGLVIDGGFAWGRQRETQNGADSVAKAGAIVVQHAYADDAPPTNGDVGCAVESAASANGVELVTAVYTDSQGTPLVPELPVGACDPGAGGSVRTDLDAQGVKATTRTEHETFLMRVIGISEVTVTADATAVVGPQVAFCPANAGCGILPVTFPLSAIRCDGTNSQIVIGEPEWPIIEPEEATPGNLSIIPLCATEAGTEAPGSVGWLDYGCGNLSTTIADPCNQTIPRDAWLQTQTGNVNSVEDELNEYGGDQPGVAEYLETDLDRDEVWPIPIHKNTCESDPDGPNNDIVPPDPPCPEGDWSGVGDNTYYQTAYFVGFMLDQAYIQGNDTVECNSPPGSPTGTAGSGATSCIKGWFVDKFEAPGTVGVGDLTPGEPVPMGVTLVE